MENKGLKHQILHRRARDLLFLKRFLIISSEGREMVEFYTVLSSRKWALLVFICGVNIGRSNSRERSRNIATLYVYLGGTNGHSLAVIFKS